MKTSLFKHLRIIQVSLLIFVCLKSEAQTNFNPLLNSQSLYWYGLDFSNLIIYDHTKINDGEEVKKRVCPSWQGHFTNKVSNDKMKKWFKKKQVNDVSSQFFSTCDSLNPNNFIQIDGEHQLSEDQLKEIVKSYNLKETEGLGLIAILERFSKTDQKAYVRGVFFNIATREILFSVLEAGDWSSWGFTYLYGNAIIDGVSRVGDRYRRDVLRNF